MTNGFRMKLVFTVLATFTLVLGHDPSFAAASSQSAKTSAKTNPSKKPTPKPSIAPQNSNPTTSSTQRGFQGGGFADLTEAQKSCLAKNGFTIPVRPTDAPSARPNGVRPSFSPGQPNAQRTPSQGANGSGSRFDPTTIQKAFNACGIAAPQFGRGPDNSTNVQPTMKATVKPSPSTSANPKQTAFIKCMTAAGIKNSGSVLAYDQSDPDTALTLIKCQKSSGFTLPKK
jgi:hypothetical protein